MNKINLIILLPALAFIAGCQTASFGVDVRNLLPGKIDSLTVKIDDREIVTGGYDFGPINPRQESGVGAIRGSRPKKISINWEFNGALFSKDVTMSKAASRLIRGDSENIRVFVTENQVPLIFIDVREPHDIGTPIYYDLTGGKLSAIDADVLSILRGYEREAIDSEIVNSKLKSWEEQGGMLRGRPVSPAG